MLVQESNSTATANDTGVFCAIDHDASGVVNLTCDYILVSTAGALGTFEVSIDTSKTLNGSTLTTAQES